MEHESRVIWKTLPGQCARVCMHVCMYYDKYFKRPGSLPIRFFVSTDSLAAVCTNAILYQFPYIDVRICYVFRVSNSVNARTRREFRGAFADSRKEPVSVVMFIRPPVCPTVPPSVCLSIRMYQRGSRWKFSHEIWYLGLLCRESPDLVKFGQKYRTRHMTTKV